MLLGYFISIRTPNKGNIYRTSLDLDIKELAYSGNYEIRFWNT